MRNALRDHFTSFRRSKKEEPLNICARVLDFSWFDQWAGYEYVMFNAAKPKVIESFTANPELTYEDGHIMLLPNGVADSRPESLSRIELAKVLIDGKLFKEAREIVEPCTDHLIKV